MVTEDYVSFETAKLLKEKGFDAYCTKFYNNLNQDRTFELYNAQQLERASAVSNKTLDDYLPTLQVKSIGYAAPTLQMAMKWLRKNFNMNPVPYATNIGWYFEVFDLAQRDITGCALLYEVGIPSKEYTFDTYEEACEAAIKYCVENLVNAE